MSVPYLGWVLICMGLASFITVVGSPIGIVLIFIGVMMLCFGGGKKE